MSRRGGMSRKDMEYKKAAEALHKTAEALKKQEQPKIVIQMIQNADVSNGD